MGAHNKNTFTYAVSGTDAGTWGIPEGNVSYVYASGIEQDITSKDIASVIAPENGSLMLMPQTVNPGTFKFEVKYDVYNTADGSLLGADVIKTAEMEALQMGKKYAYTLVLPATENDNIAFSVSVSDWDASSVETEREVRFDAYRLTGTSDATVIAELITGYTPSVIYLQEVKITADQLAEDLTINISSLNTGAKTGSKVILDCTITDWNGKSISVTNVPAGWSVSSVDPLTANGKITINKN